MTTSIIARINSAYESGHADNMRLVAASMSEIPVSFLEQLLSRAVCEERVDLAVEIVKMFGYRRERIQRAVFAQRDHPDALRVLARAVIVLGRVSECDCDNYYSDLWKDACDMLEGYSNLLDTVFSEMVDEYVVRPDGDMDKMLCRVYGRWSIITKFRGRSDKYVPQLVRGLANAELAWLNDQTMSYALEDLRAPFPCEIMSFQRAPTFFGMHDALPLLAWAEARGALGARKVASQLIEMALNADDVAAFDRAAAVWRSC
jgi:hypothetical protein